MYILVMIMISQYIFDSLAFGNLYSSSSQLLQYSRATHEYVFLSFLTYSMTMAKWKVNPNSAALHTVPPKPKDCCPNFS